MKIINNKNETKIKRFTCLKNKNTVKWTSFSIECPF